MTSFSCHDVKGNMPAWLMNSIISSETKREMGMMYDKIKRDQGPVKKWSFYI